MKTVLIELLAFVLLCVFGAAAGGFFIMIYHGVASFVVGSQMNVFSIQHFVNGAMIFFPIFLLFIPMFLFLTLIRHPIYNKIAGSITIALLSLSVWIFAAPIFYTASQEKSQALANSESLDLSSGYFRNINGNTYYFTLTTGNYVSGIRINGNYFSSAESSNSVRFLDSNYMNFKRDWLGFCDPLVGENLTPPPVLSNFLRGISIVHQKAYEASSEGTLSWLFFSSIMAALVSVGAVISASEWKMADAFYITFDTVVILVLNSLCLFGVFDSAIAELAGQGKILAFVAGHFQAAINCLIILGLCFLGIFKAAVHAAKQKRRGL